MALLIKGILADLGHDQIQYQFRVNDTRINDRVFVFALYTTTKKRSKEQGNERQWIARELKRRHTELWKRYHEHLEDMALVKDGPLTGHNRREKVDAMLRKVKEPGSLHR